jgi:hypothetical protein
VKIRTPTSVLRTYVAEVTRIQLASFWLHGDADVRGATSSTVSLSLFILYGNYIQLKKDPTDQSDEPKTR